MRRISVFIILFISMFFFNAITALADPRMEINDNFCHCILDPIDTDNEVFIAACNSSITVAKTVEKKIETDQNMQTEEDLENEIYCDGYSANGSARVARKAPEVAAPLAAGEERILTSDDSETACVMVDSNGREYRSRNWVSSIKVSRANKKGVVWVVYELICLDGE